MKTFIERLSNLKTNEDTGCWEWQRYCDKDGYGQINREGRMVMVHRAVWGTVFGEIPKGLCVLHECDNPPCANPAHLWLGTLADNNADRDAKGRCNGGAPHGEANGSAKITEAKVREIRTRYAEGNVTHRELAAEYGVHMAQIGRVVRRERWAHVA